MSDTSQNRAYLRAAIEQNLGDFELSVEFELSSPWTVLFGPSGAGKTSLLRALGGLSRPARPARNKHGEKPAAGLRSACIIFRGRTLMDLTRGIWEPPGKRRIGFVTQQPALFPHMDVAANIGFGLAGMGRAARRERIAEMLDLFDAEPLAGRMPVALSGGEKQRVALARALAPQPEMLLLDEPFSGLDAPLKESILGDLTAWLHARNIPALYVSHDVAEAFQTGADVIVLRHGRIEAQGPPDLVLAGERERLLRQLDAKSSQQAAKATAQNRA